MRPADGDFEKVACLPRTGDEGMSFLPGVAEAYFFQLKVVHL